MQNPEEPNAEQEPNAEHHVAKILVEVLILRSICGPLKRKLMAFSCHIQLSRVPPRCVMLWRSPEMNFTRLPRVAKLFCIGSPLNRSRGVTYCSYWVGDKFLPTAFKPKFKLKCCSGVWRIKCFLGQCQSSIISDLLKKQTFLLEEERKTLMSRLDRDINLCHDYMSRSHVAIRCPFFSWISRFCC